MLRPIAPFVEYGLNYSYIAKVLCINKEVPEMQCNGKCYLMKKLQKQQEEDKKALQISMDKYPVGFVNIQSLEGKITSNFLKKGFKFTENYTFLFTETVFHPPTV